MAPDFFLRCESCRWARTPYEGALYTLCGRFPEANAPIYRSPYPSTDQAFASPAMCGGGRNWERREGGSG